MLRPVPGVIVAWVVKCTRDAFSDSCLHIGDDDLEWVPKGRIDCFQ